MDFTTPYLNPYATIPRFTIPQVNQNNSFVLVQGENAVKSWYVAPGTTVAVCDTEAKKIHVKTADNMGQVTTTILSYTKDDGYGNSTATPNYITKDDLQDLYNQIRELRDDLDNLPIKRSKKKEDD